jgi:YegS/Rv2252/BmrU family lipid kinase
MKIAAAENTFLAIVNPAAGGGRCGKLAPEWLERIRSAGIPLEIVESTAPGHASRLAGEAWRMGYRHYLAVGGDGTSYEIINGLFPVARPGDLPTLAFLPLGTGNSFLRDFTVQGAEYSLEAIRKGRWRFCDVLRMKHSTGVIHFFNLLSVGFTADVAALTNRRFKRLGELGYLLGVLVCVVRLRRRPFPLRIGGTEEIDRRSCLFLTFNNSKYTGGKMMIAPLADPTDGLIEYVRWGPIGRLGLLQNLSTLYDGTHIHHRLAEHKPAQRIDFFLDGPVDCMVDGEVLTLHCQSLEVLPSALRVMV